MGELLDELESTVKFLFQSAEESGHGSNYYVVHGCFEDIDAAMAMHVMNEIPKGTVNIDDGPAWHQAIDSSSRSMGNRILRFNQRFLKQVIHKKNDRSQETVVFAWDG